MAAVICAGAVNANLMELKRRVNGTLQGMLTVSASLETARARLERKQEEAVRVPRVYGAHVVSLPESLGSAIT